MTVAYGLLLLALATLGCRSEAGTPQAAARPSGEVRILIPAQPATLNPDLELDEAAGVIGRNVFSHLVTVTESGHVIGELAEDWHISDNGLTYTFRLREGVYWHDGTPLGADDVRWTYEQVARDGWAREALTSVARMECPDDRTFVMHLKHRWAPMLTELAGFGLSILPRHVYGDADWRSHPANHQPIGTGPFRFVALRDGRYELAANPRYFRPGPFVERLVFEPVTSSAHAYDQLENGAAHYSLLPPPLDRMNDEPARNVRVRVLPSSGRIYAAFNHRRPLLGDARVRRAIASAIDRLGLVDQVMRGRGAAAIGWYTPAVDWAYNANARVPDYDPDAASQLLDSAGLTRPRRRGATLSVVTFAADPFPAVAQHVAGALDALGFATRVDAVAPGDMPRRVLANRDFDIVVLTGAHGPDPDAMRQRFAPLGDANYLGYESAAFREALDAGAASNDRATRARAYFRAQEILAADVPFVPLVEAVKVIAHHERLYGLPQLESQDLVGLLDFSLVRLDGGELDGRPQ